MKVDGFTDMVAIPAFPAGAMENWGLITYRESALLSDPHVSSTTHQKWVASVVAHELAHQVRCSVVVHVVAITFRAAVNKS